MSTPYEPLTMSPEREQEIRNREHREALYGTYKYDVSELLAELDATRAKLADAEQEVSNG